MATAACHPAKADRFSAALGRRRRPRGLTPAAHALCRLARRNLANSGRAPAAAGPTAYGEMAARRFRRFMPHRPLPPTVVRAYYAGCSNHLKRNVACDAIGVANQGA